MKKRRVLVFVVLFAVFLCIGRIVSADYSLSCIELSWCPASAEHCHGAVVDYDWCQIKCTQIDQTIKYVNCEMPSGK
jgi:hypothetical protein